MPHQRDFDKRCGRCGKTVRFVACGKCRGKVNYPRTTCRDCANTGSVCSVNASHGAG